MANNEDDTTAPEVAKANELGIFISEDNDFRIVVPKEWNAKKEMPKFAYLAVAAILRLSTAKQEAFAQELYAWAEKHVDQPKKSLDDVAPSEDKRIVYH